MDTIYSVADIGALIRKSRKDQGLTQKDVAGLVGMSLRLIGEIERGKETAEIAKVLQLLNVLQVPLYTDFIIDRNQN